MPAGGFCAGWLFPIVCCLCCVCVFAWVCGIVGLLALVWVFGGVEVGWLTVGCCMIVGFLIVWLLLVCWLCC